MKNDFFISYTHADKKWAEWIAWQLEDARYSVMLQSWQFQPGQSFVQNRNALAIIEQVLGPEHPNTAASLNNLASLYQDQERYEEAELLYQRALAIRERVLGSEHPYTIGTRRGLASVLRQMQRIEEAEALEALDEEDGDTEMNVNDKDAEE